jgi:hypothetical protein
MVCWSLLGFIGTYVVNVALIGAYLTAHGNLEAVAAQKGMRLAAVDETVALVDARLELNRKKIA